MDNSGICPNCNNRMIWIERSIITKYFEFNENRDIWEEHKTKYALDIPLDSDYECTFCGFIKKNDVSNKKHLDEIGLRRID